VTAPVNPDFVVAGMPRSGTTFLYHNLQRHPGIHLPWRKELNYLNLHRHRGAAWYARQLAGAGPGQLTGDIEPGYFLDRELPDRLRAVAPRTRVILGVRQPESWAISVWRHCRQLGDPVPALEPFVRDGWRHHQDGGALDYRFAGTWLIDRIEAWCRAFGDQLLLYDYDHFARDRLAVLRAIEAHLGLAPAFHPEIVDDRPVNTADDRRLPGTGRLARCALGPRCLDSAPGRWLFRRLRPWLDRWSAAPRPATGPGVLPGPEVTALLAEATAFHHDLFAQGPVRRAGRSVVPEPTGARAGEPTP
jgi:hypothetical protein